MSVCLHKKQMNEIKKTNNGWERYDDKGIGISINLCNVKAHHSKLFGQKFASLLFVIHKLSN